MCKYIYIFINTYMYMCMHVCKHRFVCTHIYGHLCPLKSLNCAHKFLNSLDCNIIIESHVTGECRKRASGNTLILQLCFKNMCPPRSQGALMVGKPSLTVSAVKITVRSHRETKGLTNHASLGQSFPICERRGIFMPEDIPGLFHL